MPLLLVLAACAGPRAATNATSDGGESTTVEPVVTTATQAQNDELEALFWARQDSARGLYVAADVDFMTGMIAHHAQALVMSNLAPQNGASPSIRTLAARIINAQNDEIATMQAAAVAAASATATAETS